MFRVECPKCAAPYQVDERRVPGAGLKMRCPKCGTSFHVDRPSSDDSTLGAALGVSIGGSAASASPKAVRGVKKTIVGVASPEVNPLAKQPPAPKRAPPPVPRRRPPPQPKRAPPPVPRRGPLGAEQSVVSEDVAEVDLPARPRPAKPGSDEGALELDLPSVTEPDETATETDELEVDLPSSLTGPDSDLPSPRHRDADLPAPVFDAEMDLPSPMRSDDLPVPSRSADLPVRSRSGDLPAPASALPSPASSLPQPAGVLPTVNPSLPAKPERPTGASDPLELSLSEPGDTKDFGELDLGLDMADPLAGGPSPAAPDGGRLSQPPASLDRGNLDDLDFSSDANPLSLSPQQESKTVLSAGNEPESQAEVVRQAAGGVEYGEVNLGGEADEVQLETPAPEPSASDDDMEFGAIPQEDESASEPSPPEVKRPSVPVIKTVAKPKRRRGVKVALAVFILLVIGGGALSLVPSLGPFGYYFILDRLHADQQQALLKRSIQSTRRLLGKDTHPEAASAVKQLRLARDAAPRLESLAAYSAYVAYAKVLRFGPDDAVQAEGDVLLKGLSEATEVAHLSLAKAAQAAADSKLARARQALQRLQSQDPKNVDVWTLIGEVELRAGDAKAAVSAFEGAYALEQSARTAFGLARSLYLAKDRKGAGKRAQETLELSPKHWGARILMARIFARDLAKEKTTLDMLEKLVANPSGASPREVVEAQTLLGDMHLARSRITRAESAYSAAVKLDPRAASALVGLGDALYASGRYAEALARYEAGMQADDENVMAKLGVAKTKLRLERTEEATELLKKLRKEHPDNMLVAFWHGQVLQAVGDKEGAEKAYRDATRLSDGGPEVVEAYVALATILGQKGKPEEGQRLLDEAREKLPDSPAIPKALGDLALAQGRHEEALSEFSRALSMDPQDVSIRFRLAVTYRRDRQFEKSEQLFNEVAAADKEFPGLALERGLLFEASGRSEEALKAYEGALAKAPDDLDLMLRVGCAKATAGRDKEAEDLLKKVLSKRPHSAETNHCLGRALLTKAGSIAEAERYLERAVNLDPHRSEYHLYVGWAANEAGHLGKAEAALKRALELDQASADAFWQRGVLRVKQGAAKDALTDLKKALELKPSRVEAHAAMADAYYDLGQEQAAMANWEIAVSARPDRPTWRYRYGRLLAANRRNTAAQAQLSAALELVEKESDKPQWLWEAHRLMAQVLGKQPKAIEHWEAFMRLGPIDSPYRAEAKQVLRELGKPWQGEP